jgi:hypothetical protein
MSIVTSFEQLPDELQLMILKYLSFRDLYYAFSHLNYRFQCLSVGSLERSIIDKQRLNLDMNLYRREFYIKYRWKLNSLKETVRHFIIPHLQYNGSIKWLFLDEEPLAEEKLNNIRVISIIRKYSFELNLFFAFYLPHTIIGGPVKFKQWVRDNYRRERYEVLEDVDLSESVLEDWNSNVRCMVSDITEMEQKRQFELIFKQATRIWNELKLIKDFNLFSQ